MVRATINSQAPLGTACQRWVMRLALAKASLLYGAPVLSGQGTVIELKNGLELRGKHVKIASINDNILAMAGPPGRVNLRLVLMVDDGLRRTFVSTYQNQPTS